jgi:hypothetical protein
MPIHTSDIDHCNCPRSRIPVRDSAPVRNPAARMQHDLVPRSELGENLGLQLPPVADVDRHVFGTAVLVGNNGPLAGTVKASGALQVVAWTTKRGRVVGSLKSTVTRDPLLLDPQGRRPSDPPLGPAALPCLYGRSAPTVDPNGRAHRDLDRVRREKVRHDVQSSPISTNGVLDRRRVVLIDLQYPSARRSA